MNILNIDRFEVGVGIVAATALLLFIPIFTYFYFANDLNSKDSIMNKNDTGLTLLDSSGKPFFTFYEARNRQFVSLDQIPKFTQEAVIASEDKDFYSHPGFSVKAILRSLLLDVKTTNLSFGGSTITQQLVKNSLLRPTKSFLRKYQEIILASELERRYSKNEILEMYLNSVYFGQGSFGIEEAAQNYFGKDASELTPGESAVLASLLPAPSLYAPSANKNDEIKMREETVLQRMANSKFITADQENQISNQPVVFSSKSNTMNYLAPHFALMVRDDLIKKYGEEQVSRSGFKVKTTLNSQWQQLAEEAVKKQVTALAPNRVTNGAMVALDPKTGQVKALVGSVDWNNSDFGKVNIATALRQPGSSFKPIVYSAALEKGLITPTTILKDEPITIQTAQGPYKPTDYDHRFRGPVTVRRALANSLNIPAIEVLQRLGIADAINAAQNFGITTLGKPSDYGPSLVLGAAEVKLLELTSAYSAFANQGTRVEPTLYSEIRDKNDQVVYTNTTSSSQVISPEAAFIISSILSDQSARAEEFGNALTISRTAAVKTGTTEDFRDSWTIGYTPSLVVGVWVGNNDNTPMDNIAGSLGAAPIWRTLMNDYLAGTSIEAFVPPPGVEQLSVCSNGGIAREATSSARTEYFIKGTEPTYYCGNPVAEPLSSNQVTVQIPDISNYIIQYQFDQAGHPTGPGQVIKLNQSKAEKAGPNH